ncbi:LPS-assembly protein LptD [Dyadobacter sp. CECT 9623]|uniref:LPS-assembly protein LptD n=1 Tax=Dyadobacter linearis TaxID=2823330 RepID=A0ABM8UVM9_9BACT|nr:OstA-like protein [Dyadobacter sp. CECT 9623]CAG5072852.1 LPS-assembly protein LptD [Dyadobacter sp. CECT 9623]
MDKNNYKSGCNSFKLSRVINIKGNINYLTFFALLICLPSMLCVNALAQNNTASSEDLVEILKSDELEILNANGIESRRVINGVFKHKGAFLYSNLAIQNINTNVIEAFGNVKIVQGDTVTVTGDTLYYYGNTRLAIVSGRKTVLKDSKRTLTTRKIEYEMGNGIAYYKQPGRTVDEENVLTSKEGFYNTSTKEFTYYRNVKLVNKKYTLTTDTLLYNSITKWSYFNGPTKIVNKDGTVVGTKGQYNTETTQSSFHKRTTVDNETYTLTADSLIVDGKSNDGQGKGNVVIVAKKDKTVLNGDEGYYWKSRGYSKIYGHAYVRNVVSEDTLYIRADTLYSFENARDSTRKLIGHKNVFIYKSDFQGKCDSINYNTADSVIRFFRQPILWSDQHYQMEADTITAFLVNNEINRMLLKGKAFVITEDTLVRQFNQVKGRIINAYFGAKNQLKQVLVEGNGESAYYAVDDKQKNIGLNRVECGRMNLLFKENRVEKISFVGKPDGKLIPPMKIKQPERQLEGFNWRISEKPTREKTIWAEL